MTSAAPAPRATREVPPSAVALVAANAFPLVGVLVFDWSIFAVILLYWCENVIVGGFNVLRMACASPRSLGANASKLFAIPFFVVHYGMFTFVHGVFVLALFGPSFNGFPGPATFSRAIHDAGIGWAAIFIAVSHAVSFVHNYLGSGEYLRATPQQLMGQPYARVVVLHIAILGGGFAAKAVGAPVGALLLLVVLKTAIDYFAHLAERRKFGVAAA